MAQTAIETFVIYGEREAFTAYQSSRISPAETLSDMRSHCLSRSDSQYLSQSY